jgi:hypothetical protein
MFCWWKREKKSRGKEEEKNVDYDDAVALLISFHDDDFDVKLKNNDKNFFSIDFVSE